MPTIKRSIRLNVSTDLLFRYLSEPTNLPDYCPNLVEVSDVLRHPPNSAKFAWNYKMLGVHILGEAELITTRHNERLEIFFSRGIHGKVMWDLQPDANGTVLHIELEYSIPMPLLKKHSEETILRQNEQDIEQMLNYLKTLGEAQNARTLNSL